MQDFVYQSAPMRVVFGTGTLRQLPDELSRLGVTRALVLATPRQKDLVADIREIPQDFDGLSDLQRRVRDCLVQGQPFVDPELKRRLSAIQAGPSGTIST